MDVQPTLGTQRLLELMKVISRAKDAKNRILPRIWNNLELNIK